MHPGSFLRTWADREIRLDAAAAAGNASLLAQGE
jgi:hypothetical protein